MNMGKTYNNRPSLRNLKQKAIYSVCSVYMLEPEHELWNASPVGQLSLSLQLAAD